MFMYSFVLLPVDKVTLGALTEQVCVTLAQQLNELIHWTCNLTVSASVVITTKLDCSFLETCGICQDFTIP